MPHGIQCLIGGMGFSLLRSEHWNSPAVLSGDEFACLDLADDLIVGTLDRLIHGRIVLVRSAIPIALEGGSVGDAFKVELVEDAHGILIAP